MMTEKFIGIDEKIEIMSDEELDLVAGGAATTYISQPYANTAGVMCVSVLTVSGKYFYDAANQMIGSSAFEGEGRCSQVMVPLNRLDSYRSTLAGRGNNIVEVNLAGPLVK